MRLFLRKEMAREKQVGSLVHEKSGRAPQHAQEYHGTFYRVSKHQIRRGRREAPSSTSQGSAEPLCTMMRIKGANRGVSGGRADDLSSRSVFFLRETTRRGERAVFLPGFGRLDTGSRHSFTGPTKASTVMHLGTTIYLFLHDGGLEK